MDSDRTRSARSDFYEQKYAQGEEIPRSNKAMALRLFEDLAPMDVLDVGCGTGVNSLELRARGHRPRGVDISSRAIERYRERGFEGKVGDIETAIDFPPASFDAVFMAEVIEHLTDPELALRQVRAVLRPGGLLVLTTPNSAFWLYRLGAIAGYTVSDLQHPKHHRFFSRRSLHRLLEAEGFSVDRSLGRNMYAILPDPPLAPLQEGLARLGFQREVRFMTGKAFWHLSHASDLANTVFADTLIVVGRRSG